MTESVVTAVESGFRLRSASSWTVFSCFSASTGECAWTDIGLEMMCSSVDVKLPSAVFFSKRFSEGAMTQAQLEI
jgi:hypothetical protein